MTPVYAMPDINVKIGMSVLNTCTIVFFHNLIENYQAMKLCILTESAFKARCCVKKNVCRECEVQLDNSVARIFIQHHKACQVVLVSKPHGGFSVCIIHP